MQDTMEKMIWDTLQGWREPLHFPLALKGSMVVCHLKALPRKRPGHLDCCVYCFLHFYNVLSHVLAHVILVPHWWGDG